MHNNRRKRSNSDDADSEKHCGLQTDFSETKKKKDKWFEELVHRLLFPNLPEQYPFRKKLQISKNTTRVGLAYDLSQDFSSVLMCAVFIASTYYKSYAAVHTIFIMDISISIYVLVDILFNLYLVGSRFLGDIRFIVDFLAIFPTFFFTVYAILLGRKLSFFYSQLISTLRLIRVIRIFKTLRFFHSMRKAVLKLIMTMTCFIFICSGLFQFFENDVPQNDYDCQYINVDTNFQPSCSEVMPANEMGDCDCERFQCHPLYDIIDARQRPSQIRCQILDFNDAIYFVVITVTLVGYGSSVFTFYSKIVLVALIIVAIITIPPQLNDVEKYMTAKTSYRNPYQPSAGDYHVIVCGHVNDKKKLSAFLKEFLHPDRMFSSSPQFHVVIMANAEPSDGVLELLQSHFLEGRITYCMGSALVQRDLERVRIDLAFGVFFLCNTELDASSEQSEDTATVMRALSVSNFNPTTECFVQVLKADDRKILKDSDVDVILCLDEYKITLQAKNAICPGFSTLVENLFHSFGGISSAIESQLDPWYHEYLHGARMELYYVPLDQAFLKHIGYNFSILSEVVYMEWNLIIMGVCTEMQDELSFNPISKKTLQSERFSNMEEFYAYFNTAIIIADDNLQAEEVGKGLADASRCKIILKKLKLAETNNRIRTTTIVSQPVVRAKTLRSSFLLRGVTKARNSLTKQKARLIDIVSSPPKDQSAAHADLANDVKKLFTEQYDSDDSMDDNDYIGYASTRKKEIQAAKKAQSQTGYSDDGGDKNFGRTSMVYSRNRAGLDVYKGKSNSDGAVERSILAALEKSRKNKLQNSNALKTFSNKAIARGRKISMTIVGKGSGTSAARIVPSETVSTDISPTVPVLSPSQIVQNSSMENLNEDEEDDSDEDECEEGRDVVSNIPNSKHKLSTVSVSSTVKKRLGTFRITEEDDEDEEDEDSVGMDSLSGNEEEKEEKTSSEMKNRNPNPDSSTPGAIEKVKHKTWGTLRESVVQNSPSHMLKNSTKNLEAEDDSESNKFQHLNDVADVLVRGKKLTNIKISEVLGQEDRNKSREVVNESVSDPDTANNTVKKASLAPRRSVLRKYLPSDDKIESSHPKTVESIATSKLDSGVIPPPPISESVLICSPSQMLKKHVDESDDSNDSGEDDDDMSEKNDQADEDTRSSFRQENSDSTSSTTINNVARVVTRNSVLQLSPSQMLREKSPEIDESDNDENEIEEEASMETLKRNQPCLKAPHVEVSSPPGKSAARAPRRSVLRKNVANDNKITTAVNSASVKPPKSETMINSANGSSHPLSKTLPVERQKLPPLSSKIPTDVLASKGRLATKHGGGSETRREPIKGPPTNLVVVGGATKKKKLRLKKMMMKFNRSSRVAVLCEPGMVSPTYDAVMSQLKSKVAVPSADLSTPLTSAARKSSVKNSLKRKIIRASILQKRINDNDENVLSSGGASLKPSESAHEDVVKAPVKPKSAFGGFSSVVKKAILNTHPDSKGGLYGRPAEMISDAGFLSNHIVIFGNVDISHIFIAELRRPTVRDEAYHPILLVDVEKPEKWDNIVLQFNDVYFLPGSLLRSKGFSKANIEKAFAVILLNMRSELSLNENIDSQTLFSYLKLEQYIPRNVFFSVELSNPSNMSVLNATLMRRVRNQGAFESRICVKSTPLPSNLPLPNTFNPAPAGSVNAVVRNLPPGGAVPHPSSVLYSLQPSVEATSPISKTSIVQAVSISQMVLLSSGSSSSSSSDNDDSSDKEGIDLIAENERKQNIANFRAQMKMKKQESDLASGGFSSRKTNRQSTRQSMRSPENIPMAARGSVSRIHSRGTIVQNRSTFSNFRSPDNSHEFSNSGMNSSGDGESGVKQKDEVRKEIVNNDDDFWNATDTHHMLPVFAAARAYVPSSFESLLVQSFFGVLSPMMCEIFACGQSGQSIMQIDVPSQLHEHTFLDMFRLFSYHQVLCIGLYRAPTEETMSTLPYVYLTPPKTAILHDEDRVFLYGKPSRIKRAVVSCGNLKWKKK